MNKTFAIRNPISGPRALLDAVTTQNTALFFGTTLVNTFLIVAYETWDNSHISADRILLSLGGGRSVIAIGILAIATYTCAKLALASQRQISLSRSNFEYVVEISEAGIGTRYSTSRMHFDWSGLDRVLHSKNRLVFLFNGGGVPILKAQVSDADWQELVLFAKTIPPKIQRQIHV